MTEDIGPLGGNLDKATIDAYNKLARGYDQETAQFWEQFPRPFLNRFCDISGKSVLDVGSGPGRDGLILQKAGKEVVCLDASVEMMRISSRRGLNSIVGNFNMLPFANDTFEAVWSYTALLHTTKKDIHASLSEIHRVLLDGGIFGLGMIEGDTEDYHESPGVAMPRWFSFYTKNEIEGIVQKLGFETQYFESFKPRTKNYLNFIFKKI